MSSSVNSNMLLFLTALLLSPTPYPPAAHGRIAPDLAVSFSVGGSLCCNPTGNCPIVRGTCDLITCLNQPIVSAKVRLNCTDLSIATKTIGQSTTDAKGSFTIVVNTTAETAVLQSCTVSTELPLVSATCCLQLSKITGQLVSALLPVPGNLGENVNVRAVGFAPLAQI